MRASMAASATSRARYAAHQGGEENRHQSQPAGHPAKSDLGKAKQPFGDIALIHQMASQNKEGNGQKRKALGHRGDFLYANGYRHDIGGYKEGEAGNANGKSHRSAQNHQ